MRGEVNSLNKIAVSTPGCFSRASAPPAPPPPLRYSSHCTLFDSVSVATVSSYVLNAIDHHLNKLHVDSVIMIKFCHLFVGMITFISKKKTVLYIHA